MISEPDLQTAASIEDMLGTHALINLDQVNEHHSLRIYPHDAGGTNLQITQQGQLYTATITVGKYAPTRFKVRMKVWMRELQVESV